MAEDPTDVASGGVEGHATVEEAADREGQRPHRVEAEESYGSVVDGHGDRPCAAAEDADSGTPAGARAAADRREDDEAGRHGKEQDQTGQGCGQAEP